MANGKVFILVAFVLTIMVCVGLRMLPETTASQSAANGADRPPITQQTDFVPYHAVAIQLNTGDDDRDWEKLIDEIAKVKGVNAISIAVHAHQEKAASESIFVDLRRTPSDKRLGEILDYCRGKKLRILMMPMVLLDNAGPGEWRGAIKPTETWWKEYREYINHYAKIAKLHGVEVFMVGSELVQTDSKTEEWNALIDSVRETFRQTEQAMIDAAPAQEGDGDVEIAEVGGMTIIRGARKDPDVPKDPYLTYSANWDHYDKVHFWNKLDLIGMTSYHDLGEGDLSQEKINESWDRIRKQIDDWRTANNIKQPVLFTEAGWPNQDTCAHQPWNYYASSTPAPQLQARCFEGFFNTFFDNGMTGGIIVWEWRNDPGVNYNDQDTSYVPMNKPAMTVIEKYFGSKTYVATDGGKTPASTPATSSTQESDADDDIAQTMPYKPGDLLIEAMENLEQ